MAPTKTSKGKEPEDAKPKKDWNTFKVAALKAELKRRGLPETGVKPELVARLIAADGGEISEGATSTRTRPGKIAQAFQAEIEGRRELKPTKRAPRKPRAVLVAPQSGPENGEISESTIKTGSVLLDCPTEVIANIFWYLANEFEYGSFDERAAELASHAKVCKRLWDIANEELYRMVGPGDKGKMEKLHQFLKTVLANANLAAKVHAIYSTEFSDWYVSTDLYTQDEEKSLMARMNLQTKDTEIDEQWLAWIKAGNWRAVMGILLLYLPNLYQLHFHDFCRPYYNKMGYPAYKEPPKFIEWAFKEAEEKPGTILTKLRDVTINARYSSENTHGISIDYVSAFLEHSSVKAAKLYCPASNRLTTVAPYTVNSSNIEEIEITEGRILDIHFARLFQNMHHLKKIDMALKHDQLEIYDMRRLPRSLRNAQDSLEVLVLYASRYMVKHPIGSLRAFSVLHTISLSWDVFMGEMYDTYSDNWIEVSAPMTDWLPAAIKHLSLLDLCHHAQGHEMKLLYQRFLVKMKDIIHRKSEFYPNWDTFKVTGCDCAFSTAVEDLFPAHLTEQMGKMKTECESNDIEFTYARRSYDNTDDVDEDSEVEEDDENGENNVKKEENIDDEEIDFHDDDMQYYQ